jgi:acetyl-CoA carboxylase biotin carboxyl carrier protein
MDIDKIEELIQVLHSSRTEEVCVRRGESSVCIRKGPKPKSRTQIARKQTGTAGAQLAEPVADSNELIIRAPMVGIFHKVDGVARVGASVSEGQVVGAIESMKLLNDVVSEVSGTVHEVLVDDGMPVEYGQPLCRIEPA